MANLNFIKLLLLLSSTFMVNSGNINDVKHVILFMQENRPLDHYFGTLKGVRGFNDRAHPPLLKTMRPVFYQPSNITDTSKYQLPWHVDSLRTSASCMEAPDMGFWTDTTLWNHGNMDMWNTAREQGMGMGYFNRTDMPYYFELADAFTIGDQYYQSTFTETDPNRVFFFTGCNGKTANKTALLDNTIPEEGLEWQTLAEILEEKNITWKVYQEEDNFDDNAFAWFKVFRNSKPGDPLYEKGMTRIANLTQGFGESMDKGELPQVSFIVAPTALSEHARNHPAAGEDLSARLIEELKKRPEIYSKSVFIINYDEGGQFFDHHWTPVPPVNEEDGKSTVDVEDELATDRQETVGTLPMGMGFRVPLLIVSPWTRGGHVVSEVFDHTSILRFLEKRFDITVPLISQWRRAVAGDLTSAFDFDNPDYSFPDLPSTVGYVEQSDEQCEKFPKPQIPVKQTYPKQEPGVKRSRVLPYKFDVLENHNLLSQGKLEITIQAKGEQGGAFQAYDYIKKTNPKKYTVHTMAELTDTWSFDNNKYEFSIHGPNGFVRSYKGNTVNSNNCFVSSSYDTDMGVFILTFVLKDNTNDLINLDNVMGENYCEFTVKNAYKDYDDKHVVLTSTEDVKTVLVDVAAFGNWYDLSVSMSIKKKVTYFRRFMGRIEREGNTSDPLVGKPFFEFSHPKVHQDSEYFLPSKFRLGDKRNKDSWRCYGINSHNNMCRNEEEFGFLKWK